MEGVTFSFLFSFFSRHGRMKNGSAVCGFAVVISMEQSGLFKTCFSGCTDCVL